MLNTQSRLASSAIWLAVAYIVAEFLWTLLTLPPLHVLVRAMLDSEVAAMVSRNQTLVGALAGFGGLAVALLLDGWRGRAEARHAIERREKRLAAVLAREAADLATLCEESARQLAARAGTGGRTTATLGEAVAPPATVLVGAGIADLACLGAAAVAGIRRVRTATGRLQRLLEASRDDATGTKAVALEAMQVAAAARGATRLLEATAAGGPGAADRMRVEPAPSAAESEAALGLSGDGSPTRLVPAA